MTVDYDLVIVGGTYAGYEAAAYAAQLGARTAFVGQGLDDPQARLATAGLLWHKLRFIPDAMDKADAAWGQATQQATQLANTLLADQAAWLLTQGVDVIPEVGQLLGDRPLRIKTPTRHLTTRAILIATGSQPTVPAISGLDAVAYETPDSFLRRSTLPPSVAIVGTHPDALALSQIVCRWGLATTLITPQRQLLPQEDPSVAHWMTAQLRAEGVQLHLGCQLTAITAAVEGAVNLHCSDGTVTADTLVLAGSPVPHLADCDLAGVLPTLPTGRGLTVNQYLQTRHPRIYACGAVLGGYELPAIARQEAHMAVRNALFWPRQAIDYTRLPYQLPTEPEMARVGLTTLQAYERYGQANVLVSQQPLYANPKAQWRSATTGFCQLIAHRRGQLLGAQGVGPEASEWIQAIALLMAQGTPWWRLAHAATLPDSLMDLLRQATQPWERDRWQPGHWRRDWAENWFNWRRNA